VFLLSLILAYFIVPHQVFAQYAALSFEFIIVFAYTMACIAYVAKENARLAKGTGTLSVLASAMGLVALSACGAAACGTVGIGIFSLVLPIAAMHFFVQYGVYVVAASMIAQLFSLWKMNCLTGRMAAKIAAS